MKVALLCGKCYHSTVRYMDSSGQPERMQWGMRVACWAAHGCMPLAMLVCLAPPV